MTDLAEMTPGERARFRWDCKTSRVLQVAWWSPWIDLLANDSMWFCCRLEPALVRDACSTAVVRRV